MTLKQLRISKGLSQSKCADYLGMSLRNYQNYENDTSKENTAKYNVIYNQLVNYVIQTKRIEMLQNESNQFNLNVVIGEKLKVFFDKVKDIKKEIVLYT